jgi:hypothetical protein
MCLEYCCQLVIVIISVLLHIFVFFCRYCEPRYTFPVQSETVQRVVELAVAHKSRAPSTLFVCGTYTLGMSLSAEEISGPWLKGGGGDICN